MERFIDRIILFIIMVFAGQTFLAGEYLIVVIYGGLAITFLDYYLISKTVRKKTMKPEGISEILAFTVQILTVILAVINGDFVILIPVILYDMVILKNYIGILASLVPIYIFTSEGGNIKMLLFMLLMMAVAVYLSIRGENILNLRQNVKDLRDESVIREDKLSEKNMSLMQAKDEEIYFSTIKERNRIAREIHDNVGHMLTRAILQLGALITVCKDETLKEGLKSLKETLDAAMNNIRNSVHDLRDEAIDLPSAIEEIAKPLEAGRKVNLEIDISSEVNKDVKYALIGVVKEAVSNIIKHSDNEFVDITLNEHPSMYQLVVHDYSDRNGAGTTNKPEDLRGMGLDNIRTRVSGVGGNVLITNDNGFRIFVTVEK
ncbi:MAG: sensor histidine kinase [Lachnospiraceae bacterium]|nr:sensor histidine kinase [Lachnospiraceae bacterium]